MQDLYGAYLARNQLHVEVMGRGPVARRARHFPREPRVGGEVYAEAIEDNRLRAFRDRLS